jgi:diguanylate cyclase (GGDEF)-like protein/PAS domain S-box-containing protein
MLYAVSIILETQQRTERRLQEMASLHALVTENSRDVILLSDFDGRPQYISPAVLSLTGWGREESMKRGFSEVVHPEDLPRIESLVRALRHGAGNAKIEYRIQKRSGDYAWVEGGFRMVANPGSSVRAGLLIIVRDIVERKSAEQQLLQAYQDVERLAVVDALTGLANRRRFDEYLNAEWHRAMREQTPLSLLMADADHFKLYNDTYGHLGGDSCLRQIADASVGVVSRIGDLVARYGGEEFVVVMPDTPLSVAALVAERLRNTIADKPVGLGEGAGEKQVTVSIGIAMTRQKGDTGGALLQRADKALYSAKGAGRDCVFSFPADALVRSSAIS